MYLFKFKTTYSSTFKSLIDGLKGLLTETNIEITPAGVKIMSMDEPHTVLIKLKLDGAKFNEFVCNRDKIVIGVNLPNLCSLMKAVTSDDILSWYMTENDENHLGIMIENSEKYQVTDYKFDLLELDEELLEIPDNKYPFVLCLPSIDFQKICKDMKNLNSETMDIKHHKNQLILSTTGEFAKQITVRTPNTNNHNNLQIIQSDTNESYQGIFNLGKLIDFTRFTNLGGSPTSMRMLLKNDHPIILIYIVGDLGELMLCLAPMYST
jgi:proliferating cell nuclear antigen